MIPKNQDDNPYRYPQLKQEGNQLKEKLDREQERLLDIKRETSDDRNNYPLANPHQPDSLEM